MSTPKLIDERWIGLTIYIDRLFCVIILQLVEISDSREKRRGARKMNREALESVDAMR